LASKYEDGWRVTYDDITSYLPATFRGRDEAKLNMIQFERIICSSLDWKLTGAYSMCGMHGMQSEHTYCDQNMAQSFSSIYVLNLLILFYLVPTVMTFLCRYIGASTATSEEAQVIYTIWTESLHEYDLLQCKPSLIASSVIWLGRYSQISRENQENILIKGDNIEEKSTGMNKNGVVGKKGIKDKKVVKNDIIVNIVENVICDNNLLEQLSVCTKGYPWTSTLTHITGIFRVCNYFFFYLSHLSYFFVPFLYDIFVIFQNLFIENNLSVKFAKIDIKLGEVNTEQFAIA
jgi:Cyclin, C-terminal domain